MTKYNYCTLFDSNYLTRGLAMYESLKKYSDKFHLYIFAFDNKSLVLLSKLNLDSVTIVSLKEFEDEKLLEIKESRSTGEYCWTCTPSIIKYSIETYNLNSCTYLDADLYFFNNPSILIKEMDNKSVLITEHRYTSQYDQSNSSGIYCVQFMTFKNDTNGMKALDWWQDSCNQWCYARHEDGKFGDQKYLDDWIIRFQGIHVLENLGGGVAPWNVQQYDINQDKNITFGISRETKNKFNMIFYHFHNFKLLENDKVELGTYKLDNNDIQYVYQPYIKHLQQITQNLKMVDNKNDYNGITNYKFYWKDPLRNFKRVLLGNYNIFSINKLIGD